MKKLAMAVALLLVIGSVAEANGLRRTVVVQHTAVGVGGCGVGVGVGYGGCGLNAMQPFAVGVGYGGGFNQFGVGFNRGVFIGRRGVAVVGNGVGVGMGVGRLRHR